MSDDPLMEVAYRALKDEVFFKALSKDPVAAVRDAGMRLTSDEEEKLRRAMSEPTPVTLDLPYFLREARAKLMMDGTSFRWVGFSWVDAPRGHDSEKE